MYIFLHGESLGCRHLVELEFQVLAAVTRFIDDKNLEINRQFDEDVNQSPITSSTICYA